MYVNPGTFIMNLDSICDSILAIKIFIQKFASLSYGYLLLATKLTLIA